MNAEDDSLLLEEEAVILAAEAIFYKRQQEQRREKWRENAYGQDVGCFVAYYIWAIWMSDEGTNQRRPFLIATRHTVTKSWTI